MVWGLMQQMEVNASSDRYKDVRIHSGRTQDEAEEGGHNVKLISECSTNNNALDNIHADSINASSYFLLARFFFFLAS